MLRYRNGSKICVCDNPASPGTILRLTYFKKWGDIHYCMKRVKMCFKLFDVDKADKNGVIFPVEVADKIV